MENDVFTLQKTFAVMRIFNGIQTPIRLDIYSNSGKPHLFKVQIIATILYDMSPSALNSITGTRGMFSTDLILADVTTMMLSNREFVTGHQSTSAEKFAEIVLADVDDFLVRTTLA